MSLVVIVTAVNLFVAILAALGLRGLQRDSAGHWAGLSVLVTLPLANMAFLFFLITGMPYFPFRSLPGAAFITLSVLAAVGALFSAGAAWRARRQAARARHGAARG